MFCIDFNHVGSCGMSNGVYGALGCSAIPPAIYPLAEKKRAMNNRAKAVFILM